MHLLFFSFQEKKTYFVSFSHCCGALVVAFNFKVKALICLCAYSKVSNDNRSAYNSLAWQLSTTFLMDNVFLDSFRYSIFFKLSIPELKENVVRHPKLTFIIWHCLPTLINVVFFPPMIIYIKCMG